MLLKEGNTMLLKNGLFVCVECDNGPCVSSNYEALAGEFGGNIFGCEAPYVTELKFNGTSHYASNNVYILLDRLLGAHMEDKANRDYERLEGC